MAEGEGQPGEGDEELLGPQPIGRYLRLQREVRGITIEQLAQSTRIPLRSLERLEAGSFDDLSDGFVRGFVRTVAEALGLDPEDTLSRMLSEPGIEHGERRDLTLALSRAMVGLAVIVLIASVVAIGQALLRRAASGDAPPELQSEQILRRDPVRALAESMAASEGTLRREPAVREP